MKTAESVLPFALLLAACSQGESGRLPTTASTVAHSYAEACDAADPVACYALALIYQLGDEAYQGVPADAARAQALFVRACSLGDIPEACEETNE